MSERSKKYNCYGCSIQLTQKEAIRAPKSEEGEILVWCSVCRKSHFKKRRKLIKRKLPHYSFMNSGVGR